MKERKKPGRKPNPNPTCWVCGTQVSRKDKQKFGGCCRQCNSLRVTVTNIKKMSRESAKARINTLYSTADLYQFVLDSPPDMSVGDITKAYVSGGRDESEDYV